MDRGMSVSLWCEEVEDQDVIQDQTEAPAQGQNTIEGPSEVRAAWDPVVSGQRVIQRLLQLEERYLPSSLYVALIQRDPERREELAKWALEVCCECGCDEPVFPLSVSLMDRFLSASLSVPVSPYCLAASCILIASKLTECDNVTADTLCAAAEYSFLPSSLRDMERVVLAALRWDTAAVTPQDFLPHFVASVASVAQRGDRGDSGEDEEEEEERVSTVRRHSDTLAAMCVCDSRFLGAPPSLVAAAALNCALRGLGGSSSSNSSSNSSSSSSSNSNSNSGNSSSSTQPGGAVCEALAELCLTDSVVLQCYSEMIEYGLRQRLRSGLHQGPTEKEEEMEEDERAGTPTDMREIDF